MSQRLMQYDGTLQGRLDYNGKGQINILNGREMIKNEKFKKIF